MGSPMKSLETNMKLFEYYSMAQTKERHLQLLRISCVDLAGSERLFVCSDNDRLGEAKYINKSLSLLGNVIYQLKNVEAKQKKAMELKGLVNSEQRRANSRKTL